ncbi:molecular chaperone HscC [Paenibacillus dakarensis]|uniref:molecular chaperone HscC n=1 Tax=Paenibacillus dakarensis TaxID=1527293 RepID=UPI0006D58939|nr:molecular chaperone HscC [Paenibacillus dakarensis]
MATIGIDLGTTNSLAAYWADDRAVIIPNILGENLTPSIVSLDDNGEIVVGRIAQERLITHPQVTAATFKRFMGTEKTYTLGDHSFTPEELSSFVLKSLKADAEAYLGEEVTEAVISVPAYFNDMQRKSTKRAAELAGLRVERLISEPTAAAIAYGLHQELPETKFLVFDLGGGTFDVSVLELFEGIMDVKSIAGDNFLGGEDFTELLVNAFLEHHSMTAESLSSKALSAVYKQAELCKLSLGRDNTAVMNVRIDEQMLEFKLERQAYEKLAQTLLLRLRQPIERALRDASLSPSDLDAVILIGGATRMPLIKNTIGRMFGRMPYTNINPDETVALGAAIQTALKQRNKALEEVILTDVCPYTLGTNVARERSDGTFSSGHYLPLIERNTPIPVSRVQRLYTIRDNQRELVVDVYQGESRRVENNLKLGEVRVKIPPAPAEQQSIDVRYTYDINGILEVEVTTVSTGEKKRVVIEKNKGSMTPEQIEARLKQLEDIKIHPRDRTVNRLLIARGERLYEEALGDRRPYIAAVLEQFEAALQTQDDRVIQKAAEQLKERLEQLEGGMNFI